jgi:hypothetical protein
MRRLLLLAACSLAACSSDVPDAPDDEAVAQIEEAIAVTGPWAMPASVYSAGQAQYVRYDGAPAWTGGACSGCCTATSCGGGILPGAAALKSFLLKTFPGEISSIGGYCCRPNTADKSRTSVHGTGRALDVMIPLYGGDADNTKGDKVGNWLVQHAQEIGVQLVIWDRMTWNASRSGDKFNPYTGPIPHTDHLHVELNLDGANMKTPFFTSGASTGKTCTPKCDGNVIVNADCGRGDCAAFGARCVADPAPRCVFGTCPATGVGATCIDEKTIANCKDGKITTTGDCSAFAAVCSAAGVPVGQARCLTVFCMDPATKLPRASEGCWFDKGQRSSCDAAGTLKVTPCPTGQACSIIGGAHCEAARCPATGESLICVDGRHLARCFGGSIVSASDCGAGNCAPGLLDGKPQCIRPPVSEDGPADEPALDPPDAGSPASDAGRADASAPDAAPGDAGAADAGPSEDVSDVEGSCASHGARGGSGVFGAPMLLLALSALGRRKQLRHRAS